MSSAKPKMRLIHDSALLSWFTPAVFQAPATAIKDENCNSYRINNVDNPYNRRMDYAPSPARLPIILDTLDAWLRLDDLDRIVVCRGGGRQQTTALETIGADMVAAIGSPERLLDTVVEDHGTNRGGTLLLRCYRTGVDAPLKVSVKLVRVGPGERSGSRGDAAAMEAFARTLSGQLDRFGSRLDSMAEARDASSLAWFDRLISAQDRGDAKWLVLQKEVERLRGENVRLQCDLALAELDDGGGLLELAQQAAPILGPPLAELLSALTERIRTATPAATTPPEPAPPEIPAEPQPVSS